MTIRCIVCRFRCAFPTTVAVALGVAMGTLEAFADLAQNKLPMMSSSTLNKRPIAQYRMGVAMANYRAVRTYVLQAMQDIEDELAAGAPTPGAETTINARLACTHGANICMELVDSLYNTAGTSGMRTYSPLERKLRDAHGCATRWYPSALSGSGEHIPGQRTRPRIYR